MIGKIQFHKIPPYLIALGFALLLATGSSQAATLSQALQQQLATLAADAPVGVVIVSFRTDQGLNDSHLQILKGVGIIRGLTLPNLGMVATPATVAQVRALAANGQVRSVWSNDRVYYHMEQSRMLTGVDRLRGYSAFTSANGGMPVSGSGDFSVLVNDSGIDATHSDLKYGTKVIQNVQMLTDTETLAGFTSLLGIENQPNTDSHVGHGTHCAGIVGGTGQMSGSLYAGVAPGAKIIGVGSGYGLFVLNSLGGFEYALANQFIYNIRVISNSWGGNGDFEPDAPIHVASKLCHDRNIVVLFSGSNSGPGKGTYNIWAKAPWVIGVAAGTKEGGLAGFSSRGLPRSERLGNDNPLDDYDAPTITAPGAGREFESNATKFTAAIISTRSATNLVANGQTDDLEIPVAYIPFYTQIVGTSMATPFVAGVVALMLDADPTLTPDEIKDILVQTATRMPGYEDYEVGAGYVNAFAAVDKVFNRSRNYGTFTEPKFNAELTISGPAPEQVHIDFNPAATPGANSPNAHSFAVEPGMNVLDVFATFDTAVGTGDGNTIGLLLTGPDGATYSSGINIPVLDGYTRQVIVKNPLPGAWLVEARGVRGVNTVPNVSLPTSGVAAPGPVDITITKKQFNLKPIPDIQGHPAQAQIESALKNRMMDVLADGTFRPNFNVNRGEFARLLMLNTPLRQSLGPKARFVDVTADLAPIAEAVTANGSTLRDYTFKPAGMIGATGSYFYPTRNVSRLDVAVALVRALGQDAEAIAKAGSNVTANYNGQTLTLADNADIPLALRGYIQIALDKGILQAFFTVEQGPFDFQPTLKARVKPNDPTTRAFLAYALDNFRKRFVSGT